MMCRVHLSTFRPPVDNVISVVLSRRQIFIDSVQCVVPLVRSIVYYHLVTLIILN